jgi:transcriptional antiterminator RfaH
MEGDMRMTEALAAKAAVAQTWGVVTSRPHAERLACENLQNQGFEVYLPMMMQAGKVTAATPRPAPIVRPFLPGYMFVRLNPTVDRWRCLFSTRGVRSLIMAGERPALVPDAHLASIRNREEGGFIKMMRPEEAPRSFQRGQAVRINDGGPLHGFDAVFEQVIDKNRVEVLVSILGRLTGVVCTPLALK